MDELVGVLEDEIKAYEKLVKTSEEKTGYIVKADIEHLEECTDREQEITGRIKNLDNFRIAKTKEMANVINRDPEEMTLTNLIAYLKNQPDEQRRLEGVRSRLVDVLTRMKRVNDQNGILIKQAMEMVEFDLTLFRSLRQAPETANYDKRAYNTGTLLGGGGFDAKQ
ncbi:MAG: flagellar protein FlgN [Eubacterium sp.]|nr:flagellar protein FlgN [Eubacterium sp.]